MPETAILEEGDMNGALCPQPHVRCMIEDDGAVLLDLRSGLYLSLNDTGCRIWRGVEKGWSREQIAADMRQEYGDDPRLDQDVESFVAGLLGRRLIHAS